MNVMKYELLNQAPKDLEGLISTFNGKCGDIEKFYFEGNRRSSKVEIITCQIEVPEFDGNQAVDLGTKVSYKVQGFKVVKVLIKDEYDIYYKVYEFPWNEENMEKFYQKIDNIQEDLKNDWRVEYTFDGLEPSSLHYFNKIENAFNDIFN